jgi:hypothetical protein
MGQADIAIIIAVIAALSGVSAWATLWKKRGSGERDAHHALEKVKEISERHEQLQSIVMDHRVLAARDIAVIKTLAESNSTALSAAEVRLAGTLNGVTDRLDKLNERLDRWLDARMFDGRS